jgi:putative nucleotidyltransferase with HDIG domain
MLRLSQIQYVNRTRAMVSELNQKNLALKKNAEEITKLSQGLLETLAEIIDVRDPYVLGHSRRVAELATEIATKMGLHEKQIALIHKASLLHDIGKLGISENILGKPDRLSRDEYNTIKTHTDLGAVLLGKSPQLNALIPAVRHHHEFYNGEGYPDHLSGNQIAIEARIVSVADAVEAMSSDRPYRKSLSCQQIIDELAKASGTQFDPNVARVAIDIIQEQEFSASEQITAAA